MTNASTLPLESWWKSLTPEQQEEVAAGRPKQPGSPGYIYLVVMGHKTPSAVLARYLSEKSGVPASEILPEVFGSVAA